MSDRRFDHPTQALVTGASSGIGLAVAKLLADQGISLVITGRNEENLRKLEGELKEKVHVEMIVADLTDAKQLDLILEAIERLSCDLVINNAGFGGYGNAIEAPIERTQKMIQLDVEAMALVALKAGHAMVKNHIKGTILNVSSAASFFPFPGFSVYAASKGFVNQFSLALNEELKEFGVKVLTSCPGVVKTYFAHTAGGEYLENAKGFSKPMTAEFAALEIWKQIKSGKLLHIFDWRYRWMVSFSKMVPKPLLFFLLKQSLKRR
ncbi:MAG TPA: SDR family NAD(P)-dependent oxidoreductase, partial [Parachlamydiaceae bacterium]|nr:SDR family NAD(P)-dependent oxidoreductase [Parachlamydiaceae bacterium]